MPEAKWTRRKLLRSTFLGVPALALRGVSFAENEQPLGVQLYTVRDLAEHDLPGVLEQIRAIGYREVETYWNVYSHPPRQLRQMIEDHGLSVPSGHFNYDGFAGKLEYAKELGVRSMVCPMLPKEMWSSLDGFRRAADQFNQWGAAARKLGMNFAFHNHDYEFRQFGAKTGFDELMERTDPKLVSWEMDCYWVTQAGLDPAAMLKKYRGRVHLLHVKDRLPGFAPSRKLDKSAEHFTEVGSGTIDWKKVLTLAREQGIRHYFVEQDETSIPVMESLRISYRNLRRFMEGIGR